MTLNADMFADLITKQLEKHKLDHHPQKKQVAHHILAAQAEGISPHLLHSFATEGVWVKDGWGWRRILDTYRKLDKNITLLRMAVDADITKDELHQQDLTEQTLLFFRQLKKHT